MSFCKAKTVAGVEIPEGWFVLECGQEITHMLWYAILVEFETMTDSMTSPRSVGATECDTLEEALQAAVNNIK